MRELERSAALYTGFTLGSKLKIPIQTVRRIQLKNRLGTAFLLQVLLSPVLAVGQAPAVLVLKTRIALPNAKDAWIIWASL